MADTVKIDVSGLDELEATLKAASENILSHLENDAGALIREVMSTHAKNLAPVAEVGGGTLRDMIDSSGEGDAHRDGDEVEITITSHADYSIFLEYGTGYKGDPAVPHTSKRSWAQYNPDYNPLFGGGDPRSKMWIIWGPQEPQSYMRPAVKASIPEAKKIIAGQIKEVFNE